MDALKDIFEWGSYLLAIIGFFATLYKTIDIWINFRNLSWADVDRYSKKIIKDIKKDYYIPEVIVGIGRGGSILGSILSGNILIPSDSKERNIPVMTVERIYKWDHGERIDVENKMVNLSVISGKKVLLVAGDVLTGETMKFYLHQLEEVDVVEIRTACLVKGVTSVYQPNYFGKEISANVNMPWMYKGYGYSRDSRKPINRLDK